MGMQVAPSTQTEVNTGNVDLRTLYMRRQQALEERKDVLDHVTDWTKTTTGFKDLIVKVIVQFFEILKLSGHQLTDRESAIYTSAGDAKRLLTAVELPSKVNALRHYKFEKAHIKSSIWDLFLKINDLIDPIWNSVDFANRRNIITLSKEVLKKGGAISAGALLIAMGNSTAKNTAGVARQVTVIANSNLSELQTEEAYQEVGDAAKIMAKKFQDLVKAVAYVAVACFALTAFFFNVTIAPFLFVAALTVTVTMGITSYFTGKLFNTERLEFYQQQRLRHAHALA